MFVQHGLKVSIKSSRHVSNVKHTKKLRSLFDFLSDDSKVQLQKSLSFAIKLAIYLTSSQN